MHYAADASLSMPNLTLPSGLSIPLPNVSLPYMPSAPGTGTLPMSLSQMMPVVNPSAVNVSSMMPMTATQLDAAAAAASAATAATQRMTFC